MTHQLHEERESVESAEVPFVKIGNRLCLTAEQLAKEPDLAKFVRMYRDSFEWLPQQMAYVFEERESE